MAEAMTATPLRLSRWATKPMRRMFVSRSSLLNPRPLLRLVRTTSPSSVSTFRPRPRRTGSSAWAMVVLPAPESPVNQTVKPCCVTKSPPLSGLFDEEEPHPQQLAEDAWVARGRDEAPSVVAPHAQNIVQPRREVPVAADVDGPRQRGCLDSACLLHRYSPPRVTFSMPIEPIWMPHSTLSKPCQRPERGSSPGLTGLVQCVQPMLGEPRAGSSLLGAPFSPL